jgi:FlgN protein
MSRCAGLINLRGGAADDPDMQDAWLGGQMTSEAGGIADGFGAVSAVLWDERDTLELLQFKLTEENLVVTSGSTRWLHRADAEVRAALERLRLGEVARAAEAQAMARALGMPLETTLAELADVAPEPWATLLREHRSALRALFFEIEAVAVENRRRLEAGWQEIHESLDGLDLPVTSYASSAGTIRVTRRPFLPDQPA